MAFCTTCGQLKDCPEYNSRLHNLYHRLKSGVQNIPPYVYTQDELSEMGFYDDEEQQDIILYTMERNMAERGLCTECGRPILAGKSEDDFYTEDEYVEMAELWAMEDAERRAGC